MNTTFAQQAYDHIFNQLLRRDLRPGDLLDRKQIAKDLPVHGGPGAHRGTGTV